MRLGAPVFNVPEDPAGWAAAVKAKGYRAAYCPLTPEADDATVRAYAEAARRADIVIAEVGAWSNPLSPDDAIRAAALEKCAAALDLADRIGARCCVNIAGSRGAKWDGPCDLDLTEETFEMIVASVREIIDAAAPERTFYTLEPMPWMVPDSADSYLRLLRAVDRKAFAVHMDPVNLVCSPQRYFDSARLLRECIGKLGPHIRSCHAKDIILRDKLTVHLDEVRPGEGGLDYGTFLREMARLDEGTPLLLEHMHAESDYDLGAAYIRKIAAEEGVGL